MEILEILASYVRERAAYELTRTLPRSDYDLEAVLRVIKELRERYKPWQDRLQLQLSYVDLFGFDISGIHLEGAILAGAHLEGATLQNAFLENTNLQGAHLENADLSGAHLEFADLRGAHLEGANLGKAKLMGALLDEADLQATKLHGTVLEGKLADNIREDLIAYFKATFPEDFSEEQEEGLRGTLRATFQPEQIKQAIGDDETVLPNGVERPKWWKQVPELSSTEPLIADHYLIILGKTLMSFRLGDGWYGLFDYLPYYFSLSRSSVGSAGPQLNFAHVEVVFDPEQLEKLNPENYREAIRERKTPSIAWFTRHSCLVPGDSKSQQDRVGDPALPGAQLEFTVNPDKVKDIPSFRQPCIPIFPLGRVGELAVFEGEKTCVIVLNARGESLTIQIEGSEDEFVAFLEDTTEILKSVKWTAPEQPKEEAPED